MSVERAMKFQENLRTILDHYGFNAQLEILIEECAELIQAVQKYKRYGSCDDCINLEGEIADVAIMVQQMMIAIGEDKIRTIMNLKVERQLKRIEKGVNQHDEISKA